MMQGFRITIRGDEVIAALSRRIAELEDQVAKLQSDLTLPHPDRSPERAFVPKQSLELAIQNHRSEIDTLVFFRNRIIETENYVMDRDELRQAHLIPSPPSQEDCGSV